MIRAMSEIGDRIEMAGAWLRIRDGLEDESITAASTLHRIAAAAANEGIVLWAAYQCIGIRAANEDEGIMRRDCHSRQNPAAGRQSACRHCRR